MKLKLFGSRSRNYCTRLSNPLFLQTNFYKQEKSSELALDIKQLESLPDIIKNYNERNIKYHEAKVNFHVAKNFKPITPLSINTPTHYSFYAFMAMNCFYGFWHDSLIDRDIAEQVFKQNGNDNFTLDRITMDRNQLGIPRLSPPHIEEMFSLLLKAPAILYDDSQELIIAVNYNQLSLDTTKLTLPISMSLLNLRSDLILKLASYFHDIFILLSQNCLHNSMATHKLFLIFSSDNISEKAKVRERMLELAGKLLKQNAEFMLSIAKLIQLINSNKKIDGNKFLLNDLSDIMKFWNIPSIQLEPLNDNKEKAASEKHHQNHDKGREVINKEYPNVVDTEKLEKVLAEAAKNGRYY